MIKSLDQQGFTYLTALMVIMVTGVMLGATGQAWQTIMKREREEELLFRGQQYRNAIERWYKPRPGQHVATPLRDLKDLLQDPRSLTTVRYLRRLYEDPLTGKEWTVIRDPSRGISGVASASAEKPFKTGGFPEELKEFAGKERYSEWVFLYNPGGPGAKPAASPSAAVKTGNSTR